MSFTPEQDSQNQAYTEWRSDLGVFRTRTINPQTQLETYVDTTLDEGRIGVVQYDRAGQILRVNRNSGCAVYTPEAMCLFTESPSAHLPALLINIGSFDVPKAAAQVLDDIETDHCDIAMRLAYGQDGKLQSVFLREEKVGTDTEMPTLETISEMSLADLLHEYSGIIAAEQLNPFNKTDKKPEAETSITITEALAACFESEGLSPKDAREIVGVIYGDIEIVVREQLEDTLSTDESALLVGALWQDSIDDYTEDYISLYTDKDFPIEDILRDSLTDALVDYYNTLSKRGSYYVELTDFNECNQTYVISFSDTYSDAKTEPKTLRMGVIEPYDGTEYTVVRRDDGVYAVVKVTQSEATVRECHAAIDMDSIAGITSDLEEQWKQSVATVLPLAA